MYDIAENGRDLGVFSADVINSESFSPLYAYLQPKNQEKITRISLVYVSQAEHFSLLRRELCNIFSGAQDTPYLNQVTTVYGVISQFH